MYFVLKKTHMTVSLCALRICAYASHYEYMIGASSVCTRILVYTSKMYDTWDAGQAGWARFRASMLLTGFWACLKCPTQNNLLSARNAHNAQNY